MKFAVSVSAFVKVSVGISELQAVRVNAYVICAQAAV